MTPVVGQGEESGISVARLPIDFDAITAERGDSLNSSRSKPAHFPQLYSLPPLCGDLRLIPACLSGRIHRLGKLRSFRRRSQGALHEFNVHVFSAWSWRGLLL